MQVHSSAAVFGEDRTGPSPPNPSPPNPSPPGTVTRRLPGRIPLTPAAAILLAISLGLCGGYLDAGLTLLAKYCWHRDGYFRNARDFPWTLPVGHAVLLLVPGLVLAALSCSSRGRISLRAGVWLLASLAVWGALLRSPVYSACSLLLAVGLGRLIGYAAVACGIYARRLRYVTMALLALLAVTAALTSGWEAVREHRAVARLPRPPAGARNVLFIVWDTVRAYSLSAYGYHRDTTPNLRRWAQKGVKYERVLAPAPWTYPSHSCFFTGKWPYQLNTQWKFTLDSPDPTLAEYLTSRGYQTAGFAANTNCCTYETGLARGFAHFEDFPLSPRALLSRTVPGKWILEKVLTLGARFDPSLGAFYDKKWATLQSRGAGEINDEFLDWMGRRRPDRPFFAFLNYFDAHEPFVPPSAFDHQFGIPPRTQQEYQFLFDYVGCLKDFQRPRDMRMAVDCYEDCIAFLDAQLGRLLDRLQAQGLLENTDVIITSDHGEAFGDHGIFGHSYTTDLDEIGIPLVILSPGAPAGKEVKTAVSLRDLPATVLDLHGLSAGSPFPGRSLTAYWNSAGASRTRPEMTTPAFSEQADSSALEGHPESGIGFGLFQMSLVAEGQHYMRNGLGAERLFDLTADPFEIENLTQRPDAGQRVAVFRKRLLDFLDDNPASAEVEKAYLKRFREALEADVKSPQPAIAASR
jgi:arylsulfatase A-like enzyme